VLFKILWVLFLKPFRFLQISTLINVHLDNGIHKAMKSEIKRASVNKRLRIYFMREYHWR